MRSGQFHQREPRNLVGGGQRGPRNAFNTHLKKERRPDPPEFPTSKIDERKQFSETRDARPERSGRGSADRGSSEKSRSSRSRGGKNAGGKSGLRNAANGIVRQAVGMMACAVVVVTNTYQTMAQAREAERAEAQAAAEAVETGEGAAGPSDSLTVTLDPEPAPEATEPEDAPEDTPEDADTPEPETYTVEYVETRTEGNETVEVYRRSDTGETFEIRYEISAET